jgi:hypothetical protein
MNLRALVGSLGYVQSSTVEHELTLFDRYPERGNRHRPSLVQRYLQ